MRVAQMSDLHVGYRIPIAEGEVDALDQVRRAVAHLASLEHPVDRVLLTGDLTADGRLEEYAALRVALDELELPWHPIPGNHDEREPMLEVLGDAPGLVLDAGFVHVLLDDGPLRLVGLDSKEVGRDSGRLCERRLGWLEEVLGAAPDHPTLLFMHHPPFATGLAAFDADGFEGAESLGAILGRNPQVLAIVAGHQHRPIATAWNGVLACVAPSVSFQFAADFAGGRRLQRVLEPPAIGLYHYQAATGLSSHLAYVGAWPS